MIRGSSTEIVSAQLVSAITGLAFAGSVSVYLDGDHTGQRLGSVNAGTANNRGNGLFDYLPTSSETDYAHIAFTFIGSGAVPATTTIDTITRAQISSLQSASGLGAVSAGQLVTEALMEIRVARLGDAIDADLMAYGISQLNRVRDRWNADPRAAPSSLFTSFTPTTNHGPHTIGPNSADWTVTQRPREIAGANLILNTVTPSVRLPIAIRDRAWWLRNTVRGLGSSIVTDLYYEPAWPNGEVNLWPLPTAAYPIELVTDVLFDVLSDTDSVWMPFGYRDALTLTLAEALAPGTGQTVTPGLMLRAREARDQVFAANDDTPYLRTSDAGLARGRGSFNYLNRQTR